MEGLVQYRVNRDSVGVVPVQGDGEDSPPGSTFESEDYQPRSRGGVSWRASPKERGGSIQGKIFLLSKSFSVLVLEVTISILSFVVLRFVEGEVHLKSRLFRRGLTWRIKP